MMDDGTVVGGVYEVAIGVTDSEPLIKYWEQFGYHVGEMGELSAVDAQRLYGVESKLQAIRLHHQNNDHGLIRIFIWDKPVNDGLQLSPMKVLGSRWGATMTKNLLKLTNHIEEAQAQNMPIYYVPAVSAEIYPLKTRPIPFLDKYACVREAILIQPLTRQVLFQRFDYNLPLYGTINESSFFETSQITHFGMLIEDNREHLDFYDQVLGLLRIRDEKSGTSTFEKPSGRAIFNLQENESYATTDFDDPRSAKDDLQRMRSGRLKIIRFLKTNQLDNKFIYARPGSLGYSLYTLRVSSIKKSHDRIRNSMATNVTEICPNEFGEHSFSFTAPDGYFWSIIQSNDDINQ